jgi:hypothetical protein
LIGKKGEKILISPEDLVIEYCERLGSILKQNSDSVLKMVSRVALDKFLSHTVWGPTVAEPGSLSSQQASTMNFSSIASNNPRQSIFHRLEGRVADMKERRKRGIKLIYKKEGRLSDFEHGFKTLIARKH